MKAALHLKGNKEKGTFYILKLHLHTKITYLRDELIVCFSRLDLKEVLHSFAIGNAVYVNKITKKLPTVSEKSKLLREKILGLASCEIPQDVLSKLDFPHLFELYVNLLITEYFIPKRKTSKRNKSFQINAITGYPLFMTNTQFAARLKPRLYPNNDCFPTSELLYTYARQILSDKIDNAVNFS